MTNPITFQTYKAAADRIRKGRELPGDVEVCDAYDAQQTPGKRIANVLDLPMARGMYNADRRDR